jgi:hypothetical protein
MLPSAGLDDTGPYRGRILARWRVRAQFVRRQARHVQLQVDAVQQRAGNAAAVTCDGFRAASAAATAVAGPAAGTGVHRGDQLEPGRKFSPLRGTGNGHVPGFQRLAQASSAAVPLGQLVEEQHAVVCQ